MPPQSIKGLPFGYDRPFLYFDEKAAPKGAAFCVIE